jgi:hypothetical protein
MNKLTIAMLLVAGFVAGAAVRTLSFQIEDTSLVMRSFCGERELTDGGYHIRAEYDVRRPDGGEVQLPGGNVGECYGPLTTAVLAECRQNLRNRQGF